jgi:hypothetical protein
MTVSTEEANTLEVDNNLTEEFNNEISNDEKIDADEEEDEDDIGNEEGKKSKKKKKSKKAKTKKESKLSAHLLDFTLVKKPLIDNKIKTITRILEKIKVKATNFDADLNVKIMQR